MGASRSNADEEVTDLLINQIRFGAYIEIQKVNEHEWGIQAWVISVWQLIEKRWRRQRGVRANLPVKSGMFITEANVGFHGGHMCWTMKAKCTVIPQNLDPPFGMRRVWENSKGIPAGTVSQSGKYQHSSSSSRNSGDN